MLNKNVNEQFQDGSKMLKLENRARYELWAIAISADISATDGRSRSVTWSVGRSVNLHPS